MKICYINFNLDNPRDTITLRGLRVNGVTVKEISDNTPGWRKYRRIAHAYRACEQEYDMVMVGYAGSVLVIFMRLLTRKKIFYNALSTFYDSMIVSRFGGALFSPRSAWYYLIDAIAFRCADRVFIECQAQKNLAASVYRISPEKFSVHFIGTDDVIFHFDQSISRSKRFTVVFRGMFLPEAGVDVVLRAAKELESEGVQFRVIGRGLLKKEIEDLMNRLKPANVELISEWLSLESLRKKMLECHLALGQLADHPRVHTTIPHKAFESMAMKLPYLTGDNRGVMEVLRDGETCFTVPPGDHHALVRKIIELRDRSEELKRVAENAYELYKREYTPKILAQKIIEEMTHDDIKPLLFVFAGDRKSKFSGAPGIDFPDTSLYGLNHIAQYGFEPSALEPADVFAHERLRRLVPYRLKHLALFFKTFQYDIVFGPSLLYLMILKKIFRTKTKFILLNIELTRTLTANRKNNMKFRFIVWLLRELDGIVCLTHSQKEYLEHKHPFLRGKCFFVPLGVDMKYYAPTYEGRNTYILSAGRDNGRDYATVIETARRMPEREFHIVCSKRNLEGIRDIPRNVSIFIDLPFSELHKKYQKAELLLLTTHDDSFKNGADCSGQTVLLDAMANGLPVIASRKKYLEEYAVESKEIVTVDSYNPGQVQIAIESLKEVELRKEIALRARERVEKEFSTEKMAENLAAVFTQISIRK